MDDRNKTMLYSFPNEYNNIKWKGIFLKWFGAPKFSSENFEKDCILSSSPTHTRIHNICRVVSKYFQSVLDIL